MLKRYYLFSFLQDFMLIVAVLVPFYLEWAHISLTQMFFLQSWFMIWIFLLEVPTGAVADLIGRKYSLFLGALVGALGCVVYGSVPRFELLVVGEIVFALSMALMSGADQALLFDWLKEHHRESEATSLMGRAKSFTLLGTLLASPLGGLVAKHFGLNAPLLLSSVTFVAAALVALTLPEPKRSRSSSEMRRYPMIIKQAWGFFRSHPQLRWLALNAVMVDAAAYFVIWLYQPLLIKQQISVVFFGWIHALMLGIETLVSHNYKMLESWFGSERNYFRYTAWMTAAAFFVVAIWPTLPVIVLFAIVAGGFGLTRFTLLTAAMNRFIPSENRATVISAISMVDKLGLALVNPTIGFIADRSLQGALMFVALLPLSLLLLPKTELGLSVKKAAVRDIA